MSETVTRDPLDVAGSPETPAGRISFFALGYLLELIDAGRIGLPAFQREFSWDTEDVSAMLATGLAGGPAGTIMLLEGFPEYLGTPRALRTADVTPRDSVVFALLDGQQRLTALYQALYGKGETVYALNVRKIGDRDEPINNADVFEDAIVATGRATWLSKYGSVAAQWDAGLMPMYVARSPSTFFEWAGSVEAIEATRSSIAKDPSPARLFHTALAAISSYRFPALILDEDLDASSVARVFERVNKTGEQLDTFDLVVARSFDTGWDLRDQLATAQDEYPDLASFLDSSGLPIVQAISLGSRQSVRREDLVRLPPRTIRDEWAPAIEATLSIVRLLRKLGVPTRQWLPYQAQLPVLTAWYRHADIWDESKAAAWFWRTSFGQVFKVGANTAAVTEYKRVLAGGPLIPEVAIDVSKLLSATRRTDSGLFRAFVCFIGAAGAIGNDGSASHGVKTVSLPVEPTGAPADYRTRGIWQIVAIDSIGSAQIRAIFAGAARDRPDLQRQLLPRLDDPIWLDPWPNLAATRARLLNAALHAAEVGYVDFANLESALARDLPRK
jgi:hypothetical protein